MTILFSATTLSFYDDSINEKIPAGSIEISEELWMSLINSQSEGKIIQADENGNPISVFPNLDKSQTIQEYENAAQKNLDFVAQSWGYDSLVAAASYANSTNPQFKAEAEALIAWRDNLWDTAYTIEAGKLPKTVGDFLALLSAAPTKPVA